MSGMRNNQTGVYLDGDGRPCTPGGAAPAGVSADAAAHATETPTIERGAVLLHRRQAGRLVLVDAVAGQTGYVTRIDGFGMKVKRTRSRSPVPLSRLATEYQVYRPCRWSLQCLVQASATVKHSTGDLDACAEHAAEHLEWAAGDQRGSEPEPECWCPDIAMHIEQTPYCPLCGTRKERGTELGDLAPMPSVSATTTQEVTP